MEDSRIPLNTSADLPDDRETRQDRPSNVVEALTFVMRDLPGIARDQRATEEEGGYAYRGIEQITAYISPLLAKHRVVFVPQVQAMERRSISVDHAVFTDTVLTVRYRIFGPGGSNDYIEATVVGIGRDSSDKGANKAMTQAYKYVMMQTLCIADTRNDADGETWTAEALAPAPRAAIEEVVERIRDLPPEGAAVFRAWKNEQGFVWPWSQQVVGAMHQELDDLMAANATEQQRGTYGSESVSNNVR